MFFNPLENYLPPCFPIPLPDIQDQPSASDWCVVLLVTSSENSIQVHTLVLIATPLWEQKANTNVKMTGS